MSFPKYVVYIAALLWIPAILQGQTSAMLPENAVTRVSEHVYAIIGYPNVAIVVGNRATLVVDTGMGARNGAVAAREAAKLGKGGTLYLTTTHFHPEHASGEPGFPPGTLLIRNAVQQQEMEKHGQDVMDRFRNNSAQNRELLAGVVLRRPDVTFDNESTIDLGGVTVRLLWLPCGRAWFPEVSTTLIHR